MQQWQALTLMLAVAATATAFPVDRDSEESIANASGNDLKWRGNPAWDFLWADHDNEEMDFSTPPVFDDAANDDAGERKE
ncbi:hypothetical protein H4R34_005993, partial [Dimargaris verticillata]